MPGSDSAHARVARRDRRLPIGDNRRPFRHRKP